MAQPAILKTWNGLTLKQRAIAIAATLGVVACFVGLMTLSTREGEALLFSGLDPVVAGEVAAELDSMGVDYTVQGSALYVPVSQRDRLRLAMAQKGLPAASGAGYELLDDLNGFSTTADMFDAAYWRAKEGELTRTILAMPNVRAARVHLGVTRQSAFRRARNDQSASVTIEAPTGLTKEQARSIQYLTALAVPELPPEAVAVIDTQRGVIAGPGGTEEPGLAVDSDDREKQLESRLTRLLEAHVGNGNARVTVAMDIERQSMAQTERLIDPDSRQIVSRKTTEERDAESENGGAVTVASQLPDGDALEEPEEGSTILRTRRNEDVVYTGTEIERTIEERPGAVKRLSVAVLLNERYTEAEDGTTIVDPRSQDELNALEALIASAAGIDANRGDAVTLRTLPFEAPATDLIEGPDFVETHVMPRAVDIGQMIFLGLVGLVLALFVVKPLLSQRNEELEAAAEPKALPADAASLLTMLTEENPDDAAAILDAWFEEDTHAAA
jgi:flagellar M-ring protein FliF